MKSWISFSILCLFLSSCFKEKPKTEASIYHWKTSFTFDSSDYAKLDSLNIKRVYTRFFDVDLIKGIVRPKASIRWVHQPNTNYEIVPCVYITNKSVLNTADTAIVTFANNIYRKIKKLWPHKSIGFKEIQLDCDWTESSKTRYFALVQEIKKHCETEGVILSATIRLHQIKFPEITGIPPVDRGMLMCYNMSDLSQPEVKNSIFDTKVLSSYTERLAEYPLKLDLALPIYSWVIQFADGSLEDLHSSWSPSEVRESPLFKENPNGTYTSIYDTLFKESFIGKGDLFRLEESKIEDLLEGKKILISHWNESAPHFLSIYHYNPRELEEHSCQRLKVLFDPWD